MPADQVWIRFVDSPKADWAIGGVMQGNRRRRGEPLRPGRSDADGPSSRTRSSEHAQLAALDLRVRTPSRLPSSVERVASVSPVT